MELTRKRGSSALGVLLLAFGVFLLLGTASPGVGTWILAGAALLVGGTGLAAAFRPFRFRITTDGLDLRVAGLDRLVPWSEIEAVVLFQPTPGAGASTSPLPSLMLVPAAGSTIGTASGRRGSAAGLRGLIVLDLADVRQSPDETAAALARFGGDRFTDARQDEEGLGSPCFDIALRGYEKRQVDDLIGRGEEALATDLPTRRSAVRAEVEAARGELPIALRGYDMTQVDAYLKRLSAELGKDSTGSG
ncbi:DivIVA domain-containing protein [Micromonospora sp. NPDC003241]